MDPVTGDNAHSPGSSQGQQRFHRQAVSTAASCGCARVLGPRENCCQMNWVMESPAGPENSPLRVQGPQAKEKEQQPDGCPGFYPEAQLVL